MSLAAPARGTAPGAHLDARRAVEAIVRAEAGRVIGGLVRYLGDFSLAEEVFQEAVVTALERWPLDGVPRNPAGWIVTAARRRALDRLRRRKTRRDKGGDLALIARLEADSIDLDDVDIPDERLSLIFTCCHPALSEDAQVALTLRTLGGLATSEIARCFLLAEPTIAQRIVRAKNKISAAGIPFRIPERHELDERLASVLAVVYLVFNEGYAATQGELLRIDLCDEALRLASVLVTLLPNEPEVEGLYALLLLQHARRRARVDAAGDLVTLEEQDRTLWDQAALNEGVARIQAALGQRRPGPYQLQAAIAAVHGEATASEATDWWQIVGLYSALVAFLPTPVVRLNRAAALAMAAGPEAGLQAMDDPEISGALQGYHLFHAARADLLRRGGRTAEALQAYRMALDLVSNEAERRFLSRRLNELDRATQTIG